MRALRYLPLGLASLALLPTPRALAQGGAGLPRKAIGVVARDPIGEDTPLGRRRTLRTTRQTNIKLHESATGIRPRAVSLDANNVAGLKLLWETPTLSPTKSGQQTRLAVDSANGAAYLAVLETDPDYGTSVSRLTAYAVATGKALWTVSKQYDVQSAALPFFDLRAASDGSALFTNHAGSLEVYDPKTGAVRWTLGVPDTVRSLGPDAGGKLFLAGPGAVYAIDLATHKVAWAQPWLNMYFEPVYSDGLVYACSVNVLGALDPATGAPKWRISPSGLGPYNLPTAAGGGSVYQAIGNQLFCIGANGIIGWKAPLPMMTQGEGGPIQMDERIYATVGNPNAYGYICAFTAAGARAWQQVLQFEQVERLQLNNGVLYACTSKGKVLALDAASGRTLWTWQEPDQGRTAFDATVAGGSVLLVQDAHTLRGFGLP